MLLLPHIRRANSRANFAEYYELEKASQTRRSGCMPCGTLLECDPFLFLFLLAVSCAHYLLYGAPLRRSGDVADLRLLIGTRLWNSEFSPPQ